MTKENKHENDIFSEGWGILPNIILKDFDMTPGAKLLYCKISSLCAEKGYCWATNKYLAEEFNTSETTISTWLSQLDKYIIFENRNSYKRKIRVSTLKKSLRYPKENLKHNNDNSNNDNISSKEDIERMSKTSYKLKNPISLKEAESLPKNKYIEYWNFLKKKYNIPLMSSMNRYYKRKGNLYKTNSYEETKRLFNSLLHGTFGDIVHVNNDFLKNNHIKKQYLEKKWTEEEIKKGLKNLIKYFIKGYWPENKKIVPKDLFTLLYDSGNSNGKINRKTKSYFLMAYYHPPRPLNQEKTDEQIDNEIAFKHKGKTSGDEVFRESDEFLNKFGQEIQC